jgi:hypothetical protein
MLGTAEQLLLRQGASQGDSCCSWKRRNSALAEAESKNVPALRQPWGNKWGLSIATVTASDKRYSCSGTVPAWYGVAVQVYKERLFAGAAGYRAMQVTMSLKLQQKPKQKLTQDLKQGQH